ncbi:MAG: EAL domain-containing protein [Candidatus Dactylopiibacterium sp.]|nr:EAL domain-containing protein [Candidatus Dactylopiibacterium sp.]
MNGEIHDSLCKLTNKANSLADDKGLVMAVESGLHSSGNDDPMIFAPEETTTLPSSSSHTWKVLCVDDDLSFQESIAFALRDFHYQGLPLKLIRAYSGQEAALRFANEPDIAVALLDVVMETDDAGLRLVKSVREILGNVETRIALVTGQPGMAPLGKAVTDYDIDDYWVKTDLSEERLHGLLTTRLRDWQRLTALNRARRGLRMIVEGSNAFAEARDLNAFSARVVQDLARLLSVPEEGIVCAMEHVDGTPLDARIVAAAGGFYSSLGVTLQALPHSDIRAALAQCLAERRDLAFPHGITLHFQCEMEGLRCAAYVAGVEALDPTQQDLLRVFSSNINSALVNVALISRLDKMAYLDPQLGIPNRNALVRQLTALLEHRPTVSHALVLLDIDDFSSANFALGYEYGNQILEELLARLRQQFPPPVLYARLHDDVFALLGPSELISESQLSVIDDAAQTPAARKFISFGQARLELDLFSGSAEEAMAIAALMLKSAKQKGHGQKQTYEPHMSEEAKKRFSISHALHKALENGEIEIALQPQVSLTDGAVVSAEVLARWRGSDGQFIPPATFIPIAEATGDIARIGSRVMQLSVRAAREIVDAGFPAFKLAMNVSMLQLVQAGLMRGMLGELAAAGLKPEHLEIEVTESVAMLGDQGILERLTALQQAGFSIAIDDFGTGYSSLATLRSLPVNILKIDRCFVAEIDSDREPIIVSTVLHLAQRMGLRCVAEGVETQAQADWLRQEGCELAQGYHFARPMPLDALISRLRAGSASE